MKLPLALLSLSAIVNTILVHAVTISTGLLSRTCDPGVYQCTETSFYTCSSNNPAIVRISTHSSLLLIVLNYANDHMAQIICDASGHDYKLVACCGTGGCKVINGAPHCV